MNSKPQSADHRGVAEVDPRNAGPIAFFRPKEVTRESVRRLLSRSLRRASPADIEMRVDKIMIRIATGHVRPPPPLSRSLEEVDDPHHGLSTHPDIIEQLWRLDNLLPERCRWVVWGYPGLVHPHTGVIFAVGFGTIGFVLRLPPDLLAGADPNLVLVIHQGNIGQRFDIAPAGPEWRFVQSRAPQAEWCRAAYDYAGQAS
jgi:hypothetical protein